jgi:hypothetical protein
LLPDRREEFQEAMLFLQDGQNFLADALDELGLHFGSEIDFKNASEHGRFSL